MQHQSIVSQFCKSELQFRSYQVIIRGLAGLLSYLEALGENPLLGSFKWLAELIFLWLWTEVPTSLLAVSWRSSQASRVCCIPWFVVTYLHLQSQPAMVGWVPHLSPAFSSISSLWPTFLPSFPTFRDSCDYPDNTWQSPPVRDIHLPHFCKHSFAM